MTRLGFLLPRGLGSLPYSLDCSYFKCQNMDAVMSVSVAVYSAGNFKKDLVSNVLRRFSTKEIFEDICEDVIDDLELTEEEEDALDRKHIRVSISEKSGSTEIFSPHYSDDMKLALDFNKNFKFLKFCIDIDETSTETEASSSNVVNTFDKMMRASQAVNKLPRRKEAINKFTGDALEGVVNVRLQIDCNTHVEFPYYASTLAQPDICAFCAAVGATKNQDAIKTHRIVLPVCRDCVVIGKLPPKRNPIK
ncbi:uncharacterized protein [Mytilus edulis]|uniref:uncharacterized protein n=1 Tax=Mytilus edulis TaxID=6550 RepID=UPI0039EFF2AC